MKFFLDQDVYAATARFLRGLGHDVVTASEAGCSRTSDADLLRMAREQGRILVTRDRDYGSLVFVQGSGSGVMYLRILPSTLNTVHQEIEAVLQAHTEEDLNKAFVVIEQGRHRFRKL
jgi:predicted nuclease of predicted toxin-antitoxin system